MKYVKMLALAAVAAGALMAFIGAGSASAAVLCSTTVNPCPSAQKVPAGTIIDFSIPAGSSALLKETNAPEGEGETLDTCKQSTVKGKLTNAGGAGVTATGDITELTWKECTFPTATTQLGKLEIKRIAGTSNGTVFADAGAQATKVTINTIFFGSCIYTVEPGKSIGDLTEGKPAIFHANAVAHKQEGSNFACPTTSVWTATYTMTEPANTTISVSDE